MLVKYILYLVDKINLYRILYIMEYFMDDIIDGNSLTIDEYLRILLNGNHSKLYPNNCFPSNKMFDDFIPRVKTLTDKKIKKIIYRFIIKKGVYGANLSEREFIKKDKKLLNKLLKILPIFTMRLLFLRQPWEGLTWIIDLLPEYPKDALNVLASFYKIYCQFLPDDVIFGLSNIDEIIRAKYLEINHPIDILYSLSPEEFECLVAELFSNIGYDVELTKKTHDNGIDIIARNNNVTKKELILIQCKKYKQKITVKDIRELIGIIEIYNATKGIFCTSSDYTIAAKKLIEKSNRIELLNGLEIVRLCNEHLYHNWPVKIGTYYYKYKKNN
jgi:restriction system protein